MPPVLALGVQRWCPNIQAYPSTFCLTLHYLARTWISLLVLLFLPWC